MSELNLLIISKAIDDGKKLRMIYQSGDKLSERTVKPYKINDDSLSAYCYLRRAKRSFKLEGILSAQIVEEKEKH